MFKYIVNGSVAVVLVAKVWAFLWISYSVFILPGEARRYSKKSSPSRAMSLDEYRLLKKYYPNERFSRNVWEFSGSYGTAPTWGDHEGREVVNGIPVVFHSGAKDFIRRGGENKVQVAMGNKKAYVIALNDKYSIVGNAKKIEAHERFWDQWKLGLPGPIEGKKGVEVVGQRDSTKCEQFHQAYRHAPEFADGFGFRLIGVLLSSIGLILSWFAYWDVVPRNLLYFVTGFLFSSAGAFFVFLPAHAMSRSEKVNILKGRYNGLEKEGVRLGEMKFRIDEDKIKYFTEIEIRRSIAIDVCVASNMVIGVDNKLFFEETSVSQDKEPKSAAVIMMVISSLSALFVFGLKPQDDVLIAYSVFVLINAFMAVVFAIILFYKFRCRPKM